MLSMARRLMQRGSPCSVGRGSVCHMRMTLQEGRICTCWGAAGEEDAPTGGAAGMASSELAGMASVGEALTADGAGLAAGSLPAAEGGGFKVGVE